MRTMLGGGSADVTVACAGAITDDRSASRTAQRETRGPLEPSLVRTLDRTGRIGAPPLLRGRVCGHLRRGGTFEARMCGANPGKPRSLAGRSDDRLGPGMLSGVQPPGHLGPGPDAELAVDARQVPLHRLEGQE